MSAGTRSSAMTATAPASSAILACSAVTTSMMTPPLSISAMPRLTRAVPVTRVDAASGCSDMTCASLIGSGILSSGYAARHALAGQRRSVVCARIGLAPLTVRPTAPGRPQIVRARVVDVEEAGQGMAAGEPEQPDRGCRRTARASRTRSVCTCRASASRRLASATAVNRSGRPGARRRCAQRPGQVVLAARGRPGRRPARPRAAVWTSTRPRRSPSSTAAAARRTDCASRAE